MRNLLVSFVFLLTAQSGISQYQIGLVPRVSPDRGVYEKIGFTEVDINYGSPQVKNRSIWGDLVPYKEVWRAGANNATTIEFTEDVRINNQFLPQGIYAFFIIPNTSQSWTCIFSTKYKQWGAFSYNPEDDALRVEAQPYTIDYQEYLEYKISSDGVENGRITLEWETKAVDLIVQTDPLKSFQKRINERLESVKENTKWVLYLQGAEYLVDQNQELELALEWAALSESLADVAGDWNDQYYPKSYIIGHVYWVKSKIYKQLNQFDNALIYLEKLKRVQGDFTFYEEENEVLNIDEEILFLKNLD